jgi:hypothetical protein
MKAVENFQFLLTIQILNFTQVRAASMDRSFYMVFGGAFLFLIIQLGSHPKGALQCFLQKSTLMDV